MKEFLTRSGHPFHYLHLALDHDAQDLLDRFGVDATDTLVPASLPLAMCAEETSSEGAMAVSFVRQVLRASS